VAPVLQDTSWTVDSSRLPRVSLFLYPVPVEFIDGLLGKLQSFQYVYIIELLFNDI